MTNYIFLINLAVILGVCLSFWLIFLKLIRNIKTTVGGGAGDNSYLLRATAQSHKWRWPSDMHTTTYTGTSTSQRDITVLLLALFQKIFRGREGEYSVIALWGFANAASAFLIYLIGSNYWEPNVALFIAILYISSFWMWQMSLFVAHLNVGTMFFLLAVYFLTQTVGAAPFVINVLLFSTGISFCCMLFASSSSPRYILPFFAALFFAKHQASGFTSLYQTATSSDSLFISLTITLFFAVFLIFIKIFYKKLLTAIYNRRAWFLNGLISAKKYPLEHYLEKAERLLPDVLKWTIKPYIFLFIVVNLVGFNYFIPVLLGFGLIVLVLTLPDIKRSLTFYFNYIYISYIKPGVNSTFMRYIRFGYFSKKGLGMPPHPRGGGILWVPKIFFRMAPFHTLIYISILTALIILNINSISPVISHTSLFLLILTSLLPIIWAEYTKAYQIARSYSSGLIGFLVLTGFGAYVFQNYSFFWPVAVTLLAITLLWNAWKFFSDIYPARMSFNKITESFEKFKIKEIYTYDTFYNESFFDNVKSTPRLQNLKINFIKSLKDVANGWIFIPPTTHKAGYIDGEKSIEQGDFMEDPALNQLLENRAIEKIATAKFKTVYGSDNIWMQEHDVMTYLDLMLHDIKDKDHFRGYAWLLNANELRQFMSSTLFR